MPTTPYAKALISVNGGATTSGGLTVAGASTIQLSPESVVGWESARWEIYAWPLTWPTPTGWTLDAQSGVIYSTAFTPQLITLEAAATRWGKWQVRLVVNNGTKNGVGPKYYRGLIQPSDVVDTASGWQVLSPVLSLREPGLYEETQFDALRQWVDVFQRNLHIIESALGGGGLVGDVNGPYNANHVDKLTGVGGIVNFPIGNILRSNGGSNVGDIITTTAGVLTFGNTAASTTTRLQATTAVTITAVASGGNVQLQCNGGGAATIYQDANNIHFRDSAGNAYFAFDFNSPSLKVDSASGTFPAFGFVRFKEATGTLLAFNYSSTDYGLLSLAENGVILGARHNNANPCATVTLNPASTGQIYFTYGSATAWQFSNAGTTYALIAYDEANNWQISQRQRVGDAATKLMSIVGQAASTTATGTNEDGGHVAHVGGTPDGAGCYGLNTFAGGIDRGYNDYPWPADSNQTLTAAQSTLNILRISAGTITAGRDLTFTRRATQPGQVLIRNVCGFTITVKWLTGTGVAVANNTSALIGSDGTNAILLQQGT